jgi:hypothetical protein
MNITDYKDTIGKAFDDYVKSESPKITGKFVFGFPEDLNKIDVSGYDVFCVAVWPEFFALNQTFNTGAINVKQRFYVAKTELTSGAPPSYGSETETIDWLISFATGYLKSLCGAKKSLVLELSLPELNDAKARLYPAGITGKNLVAVMVEINIKVWECSTA